MITNEKEQIASMALSRLGFYKLSEMVSIIQYFKTATNAVENIDEIKKIYPNMPDSMSSIINKFDVCIDMMKREYEWTQKNGIIVLCWNDERYPQRLKECEDAPLTLFYKGNANINNNKIVSIVGTRRCTTYGEDLIRHFIDDLKKMCNDVIIVSGLAYGVDIYAHKKAIKNKIGTIGVLAHGLDKLYPTMHSKTALEMIEQGGLLSEYFSNTKIEKLNFIRRNRIVAGVSDACVVVESAIKGGALITANVSKDYKREVFAFPGAVGSLYSEGCNALIASGTASLITSADMFVEAMNWRNCTTNKRCEEEGCLFSTFSDEEQVIINTLNKNNDLQINVISIKSSISINKLSSLLFQLEMKGVVKLIAGGCYHLIK